MGDLPLLPLGIQDFASLRETGALYVDKTGILQKLIERGSQFFFSRPRRFGKSLTLSTLEAMFAGKIAFFMVLIARVGSRNRADTRILFSPLI